MSTKRKALRVVVTGGRDLRDVDMVFDVLDALVPIEFVAHGHQVGADTIAHLWCDKRGAQPVSLPVPSGRWKKVGPAAGPIRNALMLDLARPDVVVSLPGGKGTADCTKKAIAKGIPIVRTVAEAIELRRIADGKGLVDD